ncbi:hypothetical protein COO91_08178 [Nostoc flagelliforme CCNUN1]|uniref:Uncharacterized protein n=1 Tax=Nostoc flagelliforme CCNUN1 TaxID=2038116 RepID=A0A2K8T4Y5_9NOSO|nr:hypothetical protein COO91_08178 [Nostoc flagelliforme CCNUN1]
MLSSRFWRRVQRRVQQLQTILQRNVSVIITPVWDAQW